MLAIRRRKELVTTMKNTMLRWLGLTVFWLSGALLLSASSCIVPPAQPGQPMTALQAHELALQQQQIMHDNRTRDRPCHLNNCM
ncbi:MAG TPA: hypothetical protein VMT54_09915 [Candidatus Cybelea sp.]|nr:hypothetical protein [Candidatus Cybelea sp.]